MIEVHCPHCRKQYKVTEEQLGQTARCGACKETFQLERPVPSPPVRDNETRIPTAGEVEGIKGADEDSVFMDMAAMDETAVVSTADDDTPISQPPPGYTDAPTRNIDVSGAEEAPTRVASKKPAAPAGSVSPLFKQGGVILGLYSVIEQIGEGGMGTVHRVRHRAWNLDMAVKSPRPQALADEKSRGLFVREAEAWVDLGLHPNIASCFYVREVGGFPCIFIEFVDGGSLRSWMLQGKVKSFGRIIDLAIQICDGMAHAHRRGMIHRDLKPPNCLITSAGTIKITDFGLVKWAAETGDRQSVDVKKLPRAHGDDSDSTKGGLSGTPSYMAPEQWGKLKSEPEPPPVTKVTDIYAFGVQLYEMVCDGIKPFNDHTTSLRELRKRHREENPPDPKAHRADIPDSLKSVILKCMEKAPENRYQTFEEVRGVLTEVYEEIVGEVYPREAPSEAQLVADDLNNRAISFHDLGREAESKSALDRALQADPNHLEANYNRSLLEWRTGNMTDEEVTNRVQELCKSGQVGWRGTYLMGLIHMERRHAIEADKILEEVCKTPDAPAYTWTAWGNALTGAGKYPQSLNAYREAQVRHEHVSEVLNRAAASLVLAGERTKAEQLLKRPIDKEVEDVFLFGAGRQSVMQGHTGPIRGVAMSDDAEWGASIGLEPDSSLRLWNFKQGQCIETVEIPNVSFTAVAMTPDGKKTLAACSDRSLRIWETFDRACLWSSEQSRTDLSFVAIDPDGTEGITVGSEGEFTRWGLRDGDVTWTARLQHRVAAFAVSESMERAVYTDGRSLYSVALAEVQETRMPVSAMNIQLVAISRDGRFCAAATRDHLIHIFSLESEKEIQVLKGHTSDVFSIVFDESMQICVSSSRDNTLRLWRVRSGQCLLTLRAFGGHGAPLKLSRNGRYCLWGGWDRALRLFGMGSEWPPAPLVPADIVSSEEALKRQAESEDLQTQIRTKLETGKAADAANLIQKARLIPGHERDAQLMELWNECGRKGRRRSLRNGWRLRTLKAEAPITAVEFTQDSNGLLIGDANGNISFWNVHSADKIRDLAGHDSVINSIVMKGNEPKVLTCSGIGRGGDTTARLWNLDTGRQISKIDCMQGIRAAAISPNGKLALLGSGEVLREAPVRLWNLETMDVVQDFESHEDPVTCVQFHPSGRWAISGSEDLTIILWDLQTGENIRTFSGHEEVITSACFRPDGQNFVTSSLDGTLRFWSVRTPEQRGMLKTDVAITSAHFSPDGQFLLLGGLDQNLQLWSLAKGKRLRSFEGHTKEIKSIRFSPDGRYALSGSSDQTVLLWELDWDFQFPEAEGIDKAIKPYLINLLIRQCPHDPETGLPERNPVLDEHSLEQMIEDLSLCGFGWIPAAVLRKTIEGMANAWKMPDVVGAQQ